MTAEPRPIGSARAAFLATLCGVGVFLSYPQWNLFALAFVALIPLLLVLERVSGWRQALLWGWVAGFVTNAGGFYWIVEMLREFAYLPLWAALPIHFLLIGQQALVFGLFALLGWVLLHRARWPAIAAWPVAIAASETLIPLIFPWYLGNSQSLHPWFIQSADLGGVVLLSMLVVVGNVLLLETWRMVRARRWPVGREAWMLATAFLLLVSNWGYGAWRVHTIDRDMAEAPTLRVGVVQANIGIREKSDPERLRNNLLIHQRLSSALAEEGAELIIWPETAYLEGRYYASLQPAENVEQARLRAQLWSYLRRDVTWLPPSSAPLVETYRDDDAAGTPAADRVPAQRGFSAPLLTGVVAWKAVPPERQGLLPPYGDSPRRWEQFNSAILLSADGKVLGLVDKIMLMPFGERVPLARTIYRVTGINLLQILPSVSDFSAGEDVQTLPLPHAEAPEGVWRIGMLNCYEDILPRFGRRLQRLEPHVLVNLTNDAWFGDTSEPWLHQALAVFRAVEQRTWLIRSTNTGVSAFIDARGRVRTHTETFEEATLLDDIPMMKARPTLFVRLGNWPGAISILLSLLGVAVARSRRRGGSAAQRI